MATVQNPTTPKLHTGVQPLRAGQGATFLWRKLHSLLGIVPILDALQTDFWTEVNKRRRRK